MTDTPLDCVFAPRSVAVVGASERPGSVGRGVAENLLQAGFKGDIVFINPKHSTVLGHPCAARATDLSQAPDLAVVATPAAAVATVIADLARAGARAAIVLTAGLDAATLAAIGRTAATTGMRLVGPNCLGVMVPGIGLNASFAHLSALPGKLAFLSQSGAILTSVLDWAAARSIGFSAMVSTGNALDVDIGTVIDHLAGDRRTTAILIYLEAVRDAAGFMSAARRAARIKPVIVMKVGRHAAGARAALSHTGALAGSDAVYAAAFRRAGLVRVKTLEDLFDAAEILGRERPFPGGALTILTNGGGAGVIAADCLQDLGGRLATPSPSAMAALDAILPPTWSRANPIDIIGDADGARYEAALSAVLDDAACAAVLVLHCPTATGSSEATAAAVIRAVAQRSREAPHKPVLTCWLGAQTVSAARTAFEAAGIATFESPEDAVQAFARMTENGRLREETLRTPRRNAHDLDVDRAAARALLAPYRGKGKPIVDEIGAKALLAAYGIPCAIGTLVRTAEEAAAEVAAQLTKAGAPPACVLKIVSPDIPHKSDAGGVRLDIRSGEAALEAARDLLASVARARPEARIEGISVQPMIARAGAHELIAGIAHDASFGPILLFGAGGTAVEVIDDKAIDLPPLDELLARDMIERTRIARLLAGYRHRPAANIDAIVDTLMRLSRLAADLPEVLELDINPLLATERGVIALDARAVLADASAGTPEAGDHLAIAPYPEGLEEAVRLRDGQGIILRPILPADERLYPAFLDRVTARDRRFRLFGMRRQFAHDDFARWTQIDYRREMAFVAIETAAGSTEEQALVGVARLLPAATPGEAEFAILVRSDRQGRGIGFHLMRRLIAHADAAGLRRMSGAVLRDNACMRAFCRVLGFREAPMPDEARCVTVSLDLEAALPLAAGGAQGSLRRPRRAAAGAEAAGNRRA